MDRTRAQFLSTAQTILGQIVATRNLAVSGGQELDLEGLLRGCMQSIGSLVQTLGPSEGGDDPTQHAHAVVAFLYAQLDEVAGIARKMQSRRAAAVAALRPSSAGRNSAPSAPSAAASAVEAERTYEEVEPDDEELEAENLMLQRSLASQVDALRKVQSQVAEIEQLQLVLADKASEQAESLNTLNDQAQRSAAEVSRANELVEKAAKRAWCPPDCATMTSGILLFFTLSLLFLNWLHP
eukprot:m51a1_g1760 hypothetical protein (239) ;mRNA; f:266987-267984